MKRGAKAGSVDTADARSPARKRRRRVTPPERFNSRAADAKVLSLAANQHGLVTRAQAIAAGMSPTSVKARVRAGRWERRGRGVYAIAGAPRSREQDILVACLVAGADAVATSYTAAEIHRLTGIFSGGKPIVAVAPSNKTRCPQRKALASVKKAKQRGVVVRPQWAFTVKHRKYVERQGARAVRNAIPVTTVAWTFVELADTNVPAKTLTFSALDAIRRELMTVEELAAALRGAGDRKSLETLRKVLASPMLGSAYRSQAELRLELQLHAEGFADVVMNKEFVHAGIRVGEPDALSERAKLIVEVDGPGHDDEAQQSVDRIQTCCYQALGYAVVRMRPEDVRSRYRLRTLIAEAQKQRRQEPVTTAEFVALWRSLTEGLPVTHVPSQGVFPTVYALLPER